MSAGRCCAILPDSWISGPRSWFEILDLNSAMLQNRNYSVQGKSSRKGRRIQCRNINKLQPINFLEVFSDKHVGRFLKAKRQQNKMWI